MKWRINGDEYTSDARMDGAIIDAVHAQLKEAYAKVPAPMRLLLKPVARQILLDLEKKHGKAVRPEKGANPTLHLLALFMPLLQKALECGEVELTTSDKQSKLTSLAVSIEGDSSSGRYVVNLGEEGNGQDNAGKAARDGLSGLLVPYESHLRS